MTVRGDMASTVFTFLLLIGSSIGALACREGERQVVKGTECSKYLECKSGKNILKSCSPQELFDVGSLSCSPRDNAVCPEVSTRCDSNALYPHPHSCRLYYRCDGSRLITKLCPIGQLYDSNMQSCRYGLSCEEEGCQEGFTRSIEGESNQYEKCDNGKWMRKVCHGGSYFDEESLSCKNEGGMAKCEEGDAFPVNCMQYLSCRGGSWLLSSCALGEVFDQDKGECITGVCKTRAKRNVNECTEGRKRRVEGSCKKYTECEDGKEVTKTCSECMNFNDASLSCQYVFHSPCPNPAPPVPTDPPTPAPTTAAPTTPEPTSAAPTSLEPSSAVPTSLEPSSAVPTSQEPSSAVPTSLEPSSAVPTSLEPSSAVPTSLEPSSAVPTSLEPSSAAPTSHEPSSAPPTSHEPSSAAPTSHEPSTASPRKDSSHKPPQPNNEPSIAPSPTPKPEPVPKCKDGDRKLIPGECKNYLECLYGKFYTNRCNYFQHFDKNTMECRVFGYTCP